MINHKIMYYEPIPWYKWTALAIMIAIYLSTVFIYLFLSKDK